MEDLEPWNMFTNDFMPDDGNMADAGNGESGNVADEGGDDIPFNIPSPVQDMQVKEEPQDIEEILDDDDDITPFHFLSTSNHAGNTTSNNHDDDDALFDFNLDSSSQNRSNFNKSSLQPNAQAEKDIANLSPEDQYYNSMVKFEDAVIYICPGCGHEFTSQEAWKNHLNVVHLFNTKRGLNFIQLDKLYHECMECHKRIAMHSMENLLKHKFTHLPYRCSKCMVCKRQYKYRQDLMVHLRMTHREDLIALVKKEHTGHKNPYTQPQSIRSILSRPDGTTTPHTPSRTGSSLAIGSVKENVVDLFENTTDNIEVKNELLHEDEDDVMMMGDDSQPPPAKRQAKDLPAFLDDGSTNGSGGGGDQAQPARSKSSSNPTDEIDDSLEEYILFTCPQCGTECETQAQWRQHIEFVHEFGTKRGLNFRELINQQAQCMGCNQIFQNTSIRNLQQHKFSHLQHKQWMSCKLCFTPFSGNREIIKHLAAKHHLVSENNNAAAGNDEDSQEAFGFGGDDYDDGGGADGGGGGGRDNKSMFSGQDLYVSKSDERDALEQHIIYICPACGKEYNDKKIWRKHIVDVHKLGELENLNFENINDRQLKCRECDKIITNAYGIQNAQQHRMTHMTFKSFAKCRLCRKTYTDRKGLIKHLRNSHKMGQRNLAQRNFENSHGSFGLPTGGGGMGVGGGGGGSGNTFKPFIKKPYKIAHYPPKEIVRHSQCIYEIVHLIEDDSDEEVGGGGGSSYDFAKGDAHLYKNNFHYNTPPTNKGSVEHITRHKCVDCGSIFPTPQSLQNHIKQEHEFLDYQNSPTTNPLANNDEQSNDTDDLLVPSRADADVQLEEPTTMEGNFIYLCPQCGIEFRSQNIWRRHINFEHNFDKREYLEFRQIDKFVFQCKICKDTVTSSKLKGLQDHKFRHCPYKLYLKCLLCSQSYNHKPNILAHLRQRHNIVEVMDGGNTGSLEGLPKRPSSNSQNTSISKEFNDAPARPIRQNDQSNNNTNRPPGLKTVEDVISFHNAVDHESITYYCPSCNENFDSHVFWRKHIVDEHNLNSREGLNFRQLDEHHYICLQCYKRVTVTHTKGAIGQLQSHKFRHLPYKSFRCTACDGDFVRKQMFFKHLDKNTNKCSGIRPDGSFAEVPDTTATAQQLDEEPELLSETSFNVPNPAASTKFSWPSRSSLPAQPTGNESTTENQGCFTLNCPQCGADFESTRGWREHINIEHNLNNRTVLNFKKVNPKLHVCLECNEHVNGRKLRDLQVHKFKHLPYGAYLHCRYCTMKYFHISNMQEHLKNKHPNMVQKMKNYEEECVTLDEDDDEGVGGGMSSAMLDGNDDPDDSNPCLEDVVDMELLEAEAEIEEVDPDNAESDELYLLG